MGYEELGSGAVGLFLSQIPGIVWWKSKFLLPLLRKGIESTVLPLLVPVLAQLAGLAGLAKLLLAESAGLLNLYFPPPEVLFLMFPWV